MGVLSPQEQSPVTHNEESPEEWYHFTKSTVLLSFAKLWSLAIVFIYVTVKNFLEQDTINSLRDFLARIGWAVAWWILLSLLVVGILVTIVSAIMWRHMRFALLSDGIHLRKGVFIKQHLHVRWDRIQSVEVEQNLLGRLLKQGSVTIENASSNSEGKLRLRMLRLQDCYALRSSVLHTSGEVRRGLPPALGSWRNFGVRAENELVTYRLSVGRLVGASLLHVSTFFALIWLVGTITIAVITDGFAWIPTLLLLLSSLRSGISTLMKSWGVTVTLAHNGVRTRSGLISTYAQTIAPGRVHAIEIHQRLLWRRCGWWKFEVTIPGGKVVSSESPVGDSLLIPVGTREEIERMLWVILPDLGVDDIPAFLEEAFTGSGSSFLFTNATESARWFDPIGWKANAIALTRTAVVMRWRGIFSTSIKFLLHEHFQSAGISQGPLQRRAGLADLSFHTVTPTVSCTISNLNVADVISTIESEDSLSKERRARAEKESLQVWRTRVGLPASQSNESSQLQSTVLSPRESE